MLLYASPSLMSLLVVLLQLLLIHPFTGSNALTLAVLLVIVNVTLVIPILVCVRDDGKFFVMYVTVMLLIRSARDITLVNIGQIYTVVMRGNVGRLLVSPPMCLMRVRTAALSLAYCSDARLI